MSESRRPERKGPARKPGGPGGPRTPKRSSGESTGRPRRPDSPQRSEHTRSTERAGDRRDRPRPSERERTPRVDAPEPVFPPVDPDVEPKMLDRFARRELQALDKEPAEFVANHLVMAARFIDDDPVRALEHAKAALHKGSRIPVVRETLGITAYLTGDFALALRELRTHRRLSGSAVNLPMMVDCERGLGRPDKALELGRDVDRTTLPAGVRVELAIALSGARLDRGETERALFELEIPELNPNRAFSYSPDLFDAYAVVLEDLGRLDEAALWGKRANVAARALAEAEGVDGVLVVDAESADDSPGVEETRES